MFGLKRKLFVQTLALYDQQDERCCFCAQEVHPHEKHLRTGLGFGDSGGCQCNESVFETMISNRDWPNH